MNLQEYRQIENHEYDKYCDYLINKHGAATGPYFTDTYWTKTINKPKEPIKNSKVTRTKEGLFLHHRQENHVASLSNPQVAATHDYELQSAENLVPCDYLEHLLLHIMICENPEPFEGENVGVNGTLNWIFPALASFFEKKHIPLEWQIAAFERIEGDKEVYDALIERFIHSEKIQENFGVTEEELRNMVSDRLIFSHNEIVMEQLEDFLSHDTKALVEIGTGLGKTTTALQYAIDHNCNCLVLCNKRIIKDSWNRAAITLTNSTGCKLEAMGYQAFTNNYLKMDLSKYDLIICDEVHHCSAPEWGKGVRYVIENKLVKVIGLTGTPAGVGDSIFGGNICKGLTVVEGIEQGIIHPISYVGAYYDTTDILEEVKDFGDQELLGQLNLALNNTPTLKNIIQSNMPSGPRKSIIFTQSIEAMDQAIEILRDIYPDGEYRKLHSKMSEQEIVDNKKWFEETSEGFLCAVNMISEGAHYRGVNTIFMFRRTKSELLFQQQIGRIITLSKFNNPNAILFDLVNNANSIEASKPLKVSVGKRKQFLEQEKNFAESEQIIIRDYTTEIVEVLKNIQNDTKPVICVNTGVIYSSAACASRETKICKSSISSCCQGKRFTAGGLTWSYNLSENKTNTPYAHPTFRKKIYQYSLDGEFLASFESSNDAVNSLGLTASAAFTICHAAKDFKKTAYGYQWSYQHYAKLKPIKAHGQPEKRKKVFQYSLSGEFIAEFNMASEAAQVLGLNDRADSHIRAVCNGKYKTAYGYQWSYEKRDMLDTIKKHSQQKQKISIYQYSLEGDFIKKYDSAQDAEVDLNLAKGANSNICAVCRHKQKTAYGYRWSYIKADNYFDIKE